MHTFTSQLSSELDVLFGLYQLALDYTLKIEPDEPDEMTKWIDTRQRILSRTADASGSAIKLSRLFEMTPNVPANERALIDEKRSMIKDVLKRMKKVEHEIMQRMHSKMTALKREMTNVTQRKQAARSYMSAPRPRAAIA